jgi:hypothetical protein
METIKLSDPVFDKIISLMTDCCVINIQKVNRCHDNYDKRVVKLMSQKDIDIKQMFHGTKANNVESIVEKGLMASLNVISAYGKGTYFSPNVKFSLNQYTDKNYAELSYVFLCDVILNDTKGNKSNIYVCPRDDSFMIKYLISFYKC